MRVYIRSLKLNFGLFLCFIGLHKWRRHWALLALQCERCLKLGDVRWEQE
jgi:hypothetical protein